MSATTEELERLRQTFQTFAEAECKGSSALYQTLSRQIAKDDELLQLASYCRSGQPIPNLFLGAVHYLLLQGIDHPLKAVYPSLTRDVANTREAFSLFKSFCKCYETDMTYILQTEGHGRWFEWKL
ncbi:DUF2332 family protein [Priestia koreensis]|uniref:DUF2332 family protein n=1 Tax=Priestia koreensis TaxID=284581 RepID=UPI001F59D730|nr:DUF2332 family protein [Priestia koreensis]UNL83329.1 DUF2332 family protein [Priestia koreensis]